MAGLTFLLKNWRDVLRERRIRDAGSGRDRRQDRHCGKRECQNTNRLPCRTHLENSFAPRSRSARPINGALSGVEIIAYPLPLVAICFQVSARSKPCLKRPRRARCPAASRELKFGAKSCPTHSQSLAEAVPFQPPEHCL